MEIHRILSGEIITENAVFKIKFGIVYDIDGAISVDFYLDESINFEEVYENQEIGITSSCSANCKTEEGADLVFYNLETKSMTSSGIIKFICYDRMVETKERWSTTSDSEVPSDNERLIHYLIIEGLEMEFCEATTKQKTSFTRGPIGPKKIQWDRTTTCLHSNMYTHNIDYSKDDETGYVIAKIDSSFNSKLTYDEFLKKKMDYISMLSFLNGAEVRIRKECYGTYNNVDIPEAEINVHYSYKKIVHIRTNDYIMLNHHFNRGENLLGKMTIFHFDKFSQWNKDIDLTSIIFHLNNASQTMSLHNMYFNLIITFERLTKFYAKHVHDSDDIYHPKKDDFQLIKSELYKVLDKHKNDFGNFLPRAKSIIGQLNHVKRLSTKDKMYGILSDLKIDITDDLTELIDSVRNDAIHEGNIGQGNKAFKNVFLLNELIYEIILRLIGYSGKRNSAVLFGNQIVNIKLD